MNRRVRTDGGDVYLVEVSPAELNVLDEDVRKYVCDCGIEILEVILVREQGEGATKKNVLNEMVTYIADVFASHKNAIIYYLCDDMLEIPSRNKKGKNSVLSVQEYRSRLFSCMFTSYVNDHCVKGVHDTCVRIDGVGYSQFLHLVARDEHMAIVKKLKEDVFSGFGK